MQKKSFTPGKKPYSVPEIYQIAVKAFRSAGTFLHSRGKDRISEAFREKIMLAVTAVNRCAMCSYAHTGMALRAGVPEEEIRAIAAGEFPGLPQEEVRALLFAQHYADTRGKPEREAWEAVCTAYGEEQAFGILAAVRIIMLGNSVGIVLTSLRDRLHGRKGDPRCTLAYELMVVLLLIPTMLLSLLGAGAETIFRRPLLSFREQEK